MFVVAGSSSSFYVNLHRNVDDMFFIWGGTESALGFQSISWATNRPLPANESNTTCVVYKNIVNVFSLYDVTCESINGYICERPRGL